MVWVVCGWGIWASIPWLCLGYVSTVRFFVVASMVVIGKFFFRKIPEMNVHPISWVSDVRPLPNSLLYFMMMLHDADAVPCLHIWQRLVQTSLITSARRLT